MQILHSKLNAASGAAPATNGIKSAFLFEGSITDFDSRLYGSDIGTCLEVTAFRSIILAEALCTSYLTKTIGSVHSSLMGQKL